MKRADAPQAGWYPDPTGDHRLRWWDGLDWTDNRRIRPPEQRGGGHEEDGTMVDAAADTIGRAAATSRGGAPTSTSISSDHTAAVMDEARKVARSEVQKAVRDVTRQAEAARGRYEPMVREYVARARRWLRTLAIAAVIVFVLWLVLQAVVGVSLLEWLGDRIDAVTAVAVTASK